MQGCLSRIQTLSFSQLFFAVDLCFLSSDLNWMTRTKPSSAVEAWPLRKVTRLPWISSLKPYDGRDEV